MNPNEQASLKPFTITRQNGNERFLVNDVLAVEEPLEINIRYCEENQEINRNISITMRTPGNDAALALGFLFTEGILNTYEVIEQSVLEDNQINIVLKKGFSPQLKQSDRNFYATSSCGVCGKSSIDSIKTRSLFEASSKPQMILFTNILYQLTKSLVEVQQNFTRTGGIHACGLFNMQGEIVSFQEDVGRHNALDKLIGSALMNNQLPLNQHILLLSGRVSFELIQKAYMAGIQLVAAIGAPSSLAVELAKEHDITLIGFLKVDRFNIYHQSNSLRLDK